MYRDLQMVAPLFRQLKNFILYGIDRLKIPYLTHMPSRIIGLDYENMRRLTGIDNH